MRAPGSLRSVFIGSTSVDLRAHRAAVKAAVELMDQHPEVMENFGAQGQGDATSVSRERVAEADLYVLIVAWRYGYVPDGQELSVTQQEYQEALARKIPCFVYLADPATDGDEHDSPAFPATDRDPVHRGKLEAFRKELESAHVVGYFVTPDNLATKVVADLGKSLLRELRAAQARERGVPHDLPPRAPGFVGRERELEELCDELRRGESVGLSAAVAGMAGVGKSALAAEVVHALAADEPERFPGGVTWVRCDTMTGLDGLATLADRLLAAWNAALPPEAANAAISPEEAVTLREQALRARLRPPVGRAEPEAALVLLDNVEPGLPLGRALETLNALGIRALLTSRAEPSARGLRVKRLDVLDAAAALALFAERYSAAEGEWDAARDAGDATAVVEALGRLPLAIELAAARAGRNRMTVAALASELRAPDVLAKLRDPLDATASVRYAFEQTVGAEQRPGALTPTQRARFVALGLPAGTDWPRDVIEAFLDGVTLTDVAASSGADDLEVLLALSLVELVTGIEASADAGSPARVRLHPLLRQYAGELWQKQSEADRKADLGALLAALRPFVAEHKQDFAALAREEALLVTALTQAADADVAPREVDATIDDLQNYLYVGGHWMLGLTLWTNQLAVRRQLGDRSGEGVTLNNLGMLADSLGRKEEAATYYEQALAIRREVGDRSGEGVTLWNLGALAQTLGRPDEARTDYEQALTIFQEIGAVNYEQGVRGFLDALEEELAAAPVSSSADAPPASSSPVPEDAQPTPVAVPAKRRWWPFGGRRGDG